MFSSSELKKAKDTSVIWSNQKPTCSLNGRESVKHNSFLLIHLFELPLECGEIIQLELNDEITVFGYDCLGMIGKTTLGSII